MDYNKRHRFLIKEYLPQPKTLSILLLSVLCVILGVLLWYYIANSEKLRSELERCNEESNHARVEIAVLREYASTSSDDVRKRTIKIQECVEPMKPVVRDIAVSIVTSVTSPVSHDDESWKICRISYWVAHNINFVSDPMGEDYFAYASETLLARGGDCEDFAILLASMYESVGLDAALAIVDNNGDGRANHMACLVYYSQDSDSFLDEERQILDKMMTKIPGDLTVKHIQTGRLKSLAKYDSGIWVVVDPRMSKSKELTGYITHEPYYILEGLDVGFK